MRGQLVFVNGTQVSRLDLAVPPDVPFGFVALPQYVTEHLLAERLGRLGGRVERGVELVGFDQDADGVTVRLAGRDGEETVRFAYLVGADGAHSRVRKGLGLAFDRATRSPRSTCSATSRWTGTSRRVRRPLDAPDGRAGPTTCWCASRCPASGATGCRCSSPTSWPPRRAATVQHGLEGGPDPSCEHIQAVLDRLAPSRPRRTTCAGPRCSGSATGWSTGTARGGSSWPGDAAHIHPPTGAQGMNTGIQDGINLAWKLALAVQGAAADGLLASYHAERHPVGEEVVGRTTRHAREGIENDPDDPAVVVRREAQLLVNYRGSAMVGGTADSGSGHGPHPGDRAPDCRGLRRAAGERSRCGCSSCSPIRTTRCCSTPTRPDRHPTSRRSTTSSPP